MEGFESCWRRIDRAAEHRREAAGVWNAFIDRHPFTTRLVHVGGGTYAMWVEQEEPAPPEMAALIGEWAYNLRAALDYVVYETAVVASGCRPPVGAGELQFPVYEAKEQFDKNRRRLRSLAAHHIDLLEHMQPYRHDDPDTSALRWLNRIARQDRHRQLSVLTAYAAELKPVVAVPQGCSVDLTFGTTALRSGAAEIFRFTVTPFTTGTDVSVNPHVGLDPDIEGWADSPFWQRMPYNERLSLVTSVPETMILTFEYDCFGYTSRHSDWLIPSFKAERDARRGTWQP